MPTDVITDRDVNNLLALAAGYGHWLVGVPHEQMMSMLHQAQEHLREDLARKFGPDIAAAIAEAFPDAVITARAALEAAAPPVLN